MRDPPPPPPAPRTVDHLQVYYTGKLETDARVKYKTACYCS